MLACIRLAGNKFVEYFSTNSYFIFSRGHAKFVLPGCIWQLFLKKCVEKHNFVGLRTRVSKGGIGLH